MIRGRTAEALGAIDEKLAMLRSWWAQKQRGESVPEAPSDDHLTRVLVSGLNVASQAAHMVQRWQSCLDLVGEMEHVQHTLGASEHEIARTRFNSYGPLAKLGKLDEAKVVLAECLEIFQRMNDVPWEAKALSALADVWDDLGDPAHAVALARQALALLERLPEAGDRATSHNNLALHLHKLGFPDEARAHQVAGISYRLVTGIVISLSVPQLILRIRESAAQGAPFALPRLTTLLADPAFAPLRTFLQQRDADLPSLQARIDRLVEEARAKS